MTLDGFGNHLGLDMGGMFEPTVENSLAEVTRESQITKCGFGIKYFVHDEFAAVRFRFVRAIVFEPRGSSWYGDIPADTTI